MAKSKTTVPGLALVEKKARSRGELMALCLSGSHAYGLANENSDYDLQGVYRSPTSQNLLLWGRPKETLHEANVVCPVCKGNILVREIKEHELPKGEFKDAVRYCEACGNTGSVPDYTIHELFKFFQLAAGANPTVLEVMYLEPVVKSPAWDLIVENRDAFISTAVRRTYGGYAKQQLHKKKLREQQGMEGYSPKTRYRDAKHTRHIVRLFIQQRQILETGVITPMLSVEDQVLVLEAQNWDSAELEAWMNAETLSMLDINNNIPPTPNYERINELLLTLRGL